MRIAVLLLAVPLVTRAQVPTIRLEKPVSVSSAKWTDVAGVVELGNGKLVVLDARDRAVKLVDPATGAPKMIGRIGSGPGEYQVPLHLFGLPGDSAVLIDMANSARPLVVTAEGGISNYTLSTRAAPFINEESFVDARGRVYRTSGLYADLGTQGASGPAIERLDRRTGRVDTIAYVSRTSGNCARSAAPARGVVGAPGGGIRAGTSTPYPLLEQWAVAPDGRVAIVCPDPYRVLLIDSAGRRTEGPVIPYDRVRVTAREKAEWREMRQQPVPSMQVTADRKTVAVFTRPPAPPEPDAWPEFLPAVDRGRRLNGAAMFAPDNLLWVHRMGPTTAPAQYDIIGRDGGLRYRVSLPPRSRVVGFGRRGIYVVSIDADDVQRLQRFAFPPLDNR